MADGETTFGKYRLLGIAGKGGKGVVHEAVDTVLDRKVALKTIRTENCPDPKDLESEKKRFLREARLSANLPKHDNIVSVYEAGTIDGTLYLAAEFVTGQPMREWRRHATMQQQVKLLRDVALAMDHAHRHKLVHRDLKPQNILVDTEGRPHVTDFGLAKMIDREDDLRDPSGRVWGTPAYMSPEHARNAPDLDHRSDIFAIGIMLYEVVTGRLPFKGATPSDTLQQLVHKPAPATGRFVPADAMTPLHRALEPICMKALEKDPPMRDQNG